MTDTSRSTSSGVVLVVDGVPANVELFTSLLTRLRHHHERLDGSGDPVGLKGDAIPVLAQIMGVVDVFDAITTERPYKMAASPEHAHEELMDESKKGWRRKDLVEAFIALRETGVTV